VPKTPQRYSCHDDDHYHNKTKTELLANGWEVCGTLLRAKCDKDVYLLLDDDKGEALPLRTD
jgi:hypothetical protein